tara:strand:+ start:45895 stop:47058 length:1164 start_codon:yes stop_codon:yes gene_type:complete
MNKFNYVFIIESNNDLDMLAPIIWKFSIDNNSNIFIINTSPGYLLKNDKRIEFLRVVSTVKYIEIPKDFKILDDISSYVYSKLKIGFFHRKYLISVLGYSQKKFDKIPISKNLPTSVFVSYYSNHNAVESALLWAKKNNFITVFNNHGITPFVVKNKINKKIKVPSFDVCIMNKNSEKNLPNFDNKNLKKIYVAPRFSKEWSNKLNEIYPKKNFDFENKKFRVSFMLSKWLEKDDKKLILSAIKASSKIKSIEVTVKPHTRGMVINESLPSNVFIPDEDLHSREIIQDSDVIIFTRSSIFLDAVLLGKPVLHLSYATKVDLASDALNSCKISSQNDLIYKLNEIKTNGELYTPEDKNNCIKFYAGKDEGKMLDNIVSEINSTFILNQ